MTEFNPEDHLKWKGEPYSDVGLAIATALLDYIADVGMATAHVKRHGSRVWRPRSVGKAEAQFYQTTENKLQPIRPTYMARAWTAHRKNSKGSTARVRSLSCGFCV